MRPAERTFGLLAGTLLALCATAGAQQLAVADLSVSDFQGGLVTPTGFQFRSGQTVYVSAAAAGFEIRGDDNLIHLEYRLEAVDCLGHPFQRPLTGRIYREFPRTENAAPPVFRGRFRIPDFPYPGEGHIRVSITDKFSGQVAHEEASFEVFSEFPDPAGEFEIARLRAVKSEFDATPVPSPVIAAGQAISVKFLLAGFRYRAAENDYDLRYGITILGPGGKQLLSVPAAAAESNAAFYQKPYVEGLASVRMERTVKPGNYTLVVSATDKIADQSVKASMPFRVQ